jgi:hypothetical protein
VILRIDTGKAHIELNVEMELKRATALHIIGARFVVFSYKYVAVIFFMMEIYLFLARVGF